MISLANHNECLYALVLTTYHINSFPTNQINPEKLYSWATRGKLDISMCTSTIRQEAWNLKVLLDENSLQGFKIT